MKYLQGVINKDFATEGTKKALERYIRACHDENLKDLSLKQNCWTIERVLCEIRKPIEKIAPEDLSDYWQMLGHRDVMKGERKPVKSTYVNHQKATMKAFFKKIGRKDLFESIILLKERDKRKLPKRLVSREDLLKILRACDNDRDKALIFFLYESGARKSEALAMVKGDLIADQYGFIAIINGKTGERRIRLIESAPDIRNWLNRHPAPQDPKAPLWASLSKHSKGRRLHKESLLRLFKRLGERAGLDYHIYPHLLRHSRATELSAIFTEVQLCKFFGWEISSPMPRTYISRAGVDIDGRLLEASGIKAPDRHEIKMLKAECPSCGAAQSPAAVFCYECGALLETEGAKSVTAGKQSRSDEVLEKKIKEIVLRMAKEEPKG